MHQASIFFFFFSFMQNCPTLCSMYCTKHVTLQYNVISGFYNGAAFATAGRNETNPICSCINGNAQLQSAGVLAQSKLFWVCCFEQAKCRQGPANKSTMYSYSTLCSTFDSSAEKHRIWTIFQKQLFEISCLNRQLFENYCCLCNYSKTRTNIFRTVELGL